MNGNQGLSLHMPSGARNAGEAAGQDIGKSWAGAAHEAEEGRERCRAGGRDPEEKEDLGQVEQ